MPKEIPPASCAGCPGEIVDRIPAKINSAPIEIELLSKGTGEDPMTASVSLAAENVRAMIHDYIVGNFLFDTTDVADDDSLLEEGILDSTGVLEMVLFVEERLGVPVADAEVVPANFDSVNALTHFVA